VVFHAGKVGEQVVEAAVFGEQHHHVLHLFLQCLVQFGRGQEALHRWFASWLAGLAAGAQGGADPQNRNAAEETAAAGIGGLVGGGFGGVAQVGIVAHVGSLLGSLRIRYKVFRLHASNRI